MKLIYQIPRNSLIWLLAAQAAVILPHVVRLPVWIILSWFVVVVWRIQVYRGEWQFPGKLVKVVMICFCGLGLILGYGRLIGVEPMVALLIVAFILKLLEMHTRKDALIVIYLGFFVAATQFLFAQSLNTTFYGLFTMILLITSLLGINQSSGHADYRRTFVAASHILLQSVPLMLLLFLLMPRIDPLWSVPLQRHASKTGVSDSMSPGDFTNLSKSSELAFRVTFDGAMPRRDQLYWRGLVFSRFDGRRWTQAEAIDYRDGRLIDWAWRKTSQWRQLLSTKGKAVSYQIALEPTQQLWLYSLAMPITIPSKTGLARDFRLLKLKPVTQRFHYRVTSALDYSIEAGELPDWRRKNELKLPEGYNPRTREMAQLWRQQSGNVKELVDKVLDYYRREFTYTLKPPLLGRHSVDEFLWQSKRGFCEHFASSFVFFMRAAGVPARVVVGYQGGEINPLENYLLVHQFDAHAWTEIWVAGQGWVRVDPTAAVAPERVEQGLENALSEKESRLLGDRMTLIYYRNIEWLNNIRLQWDALNYNWQRWVMDFDDQRQQSLLSRWLGGVDPWRMTLALLGGGGGFLLAIGLWLWWRGRRVEDPITRAYLYFTAKLASQGVVRQQGEGPRDFAARVAELKPELQSQVDEITRLYEQVVYGGEASVAPVLKRRISAFRRWKF